MPRPEESMQAEPDCAGTDCPEPMQRLMAEAQAILTANPACHDWYHTLRVLSNAQHLAQIEQADPVVVECAAILHDIGRPAELADEGRTCHAQRGAEIATELLPRVDFGDPGFVSHVADCVRTHRYRRRDAARPTTLEAKIVFDADKLDCIGAVGIGRAFHFAGRIGARLHNTAEEATGSASYSREDSAYREYLVKLQHIHENMLTPEGRRMAEARHRFMVAFFERLCRETHGQDFAGNGG